MNLLFCLQRFIRKSKLSLQALLFFMKKPLYYLSYNTSGNYFRCDSILFNGHVRIKGKGNKVIIKGGGKMKNVSIEICGSNNTLIIHEHPVFTEGGRIIIDDNNNLLEIGRNAAFVNVLFAIRDNGGKVVVGEDCLFSAQVIIRNSDGHSMLNAEGERINPGRDVLIGDRVWIGYGGNILKGCSIGSDSIVGTHAVASGLKCPEGSVVAGNPARIVKQGVHWDKKRL